MQGDSDIYTIQESESEEKEVATLLRFSKHDPIARNATHFYQRTLPRGQHISHCSISDDYIIYSIVDYGEAK